MNPSRPARLGLLAMLILGAAAGGADAGVDQLRAWRWHARLLLVFAPSADDAGLARQRALLAEDAPGLGERDLVVVEFIGAHASAPRVDGTAVRAALQVPQGRFTVILIGKDGGAKLGAHQPITPDRLFATIDAMPMRQQEMLESAPRRAP
jgi:hypothetical protein